MGHRIRLVAMLAALGLIAGACAEPAARSLAGEGGTETTPTSPTAETPLTTTLPTTASSTTSTTPPSTTTTTAPESSFTAGSIGLVGCSNTALSAEGYQMVSDRDLLAQGPLGGGSLAHWGNPTAARYGRYWGWFEDRRPDEGYTGVYIQVCLRESEHSGELDETLEGYAEHLIEQLRLREPDAQIWVSSVNSYSWDCGAGTTTAPVIGSMVADWMVETFSGVQAGPATGPLGPSDVKVDDCHPNEAGMVLLGTQLRDFFDDI